MAKEAMAFPGSGSANDGMQLRDYFAVRIIQTTLPDPSCSAWDADYHARNAYRVADAMLRARESNS